MHERKDINGGVGPSPSADSPSPAPTNSQAGSEDVSTGTYSQRATLTVLLTTNTVVVQAFPAVYAESLATALASLAPQTAPKPDKTNLSEANSQDALTQHAAQAGSRAELNLKITHDLDPGSREGAKNGPTRLLLELGPVIVAYWGD
jgi:hypothetical protein